jgi:hypothetical protein
MSIHISVESIQGKQRKEILEEIKQRAKEAALHVIKEVLEDGLEAEVEHQLGRKKGGTRCISRQPREIEWRCGHGGCQSVSPRWTLSKKSGDRMGAYSRIARSHAGMSEVFP